MSLFTCDLQLILLLKMESKETMVFNKEIKRFLPCFLAASGNASFSVTIQTWLKFPLWLRAFSNYGFFPKNSLFLNLLASDEFLVFQISDQAIPLLWRAWSSGGPFPLFSTILCGPFILALSHGTHILMDPMLPRTTWMSFTWAAPR